MDMDFLVGRVTPCADVVKVNALTGNRRRAEDCPPCLDIVTLHRCSFVPVRGQDFGQSFYRLG